MTAVIKSSQEIGNIFKEGKRIATPLFILVYHRDALDEGPVAHEEGPEARVAFIAGKKNGNAVWRNAAKRKLRAGWRMRTSDLNDIRVLLIANRRITDHSANEVATEIDRALSRIGLIQ